MGHHGEYVGRHYTVLVCAGSGCHFAACTIEIRIAIISREEGNDTMKPFIDCKEIQETLDCSSTMAYKIIRELNSELKAKGYIIIQGKISRKYFNERYYG